jgi:hypothetical protein
MDIPASPTQPPRLLTAVRFAIRRHQLSKRTEQAYLDWVRRYVRFHHLRHPAELGEVELVAFVTDLAARGRVAQSTQMQALTRCCSSIGKCCAGRWGTCGTWCGPGRRAGSRWY